MPIQRTVEMRMARKKKESTELSAQEIQEQLAQVHTEKKALEAALRKQQPPEKPKMIMSWTLWVRGKQVQPEPFQQTL